MLRRRPLALAAVGLVLAGCSLTEAPVGDTRPAPAPLVASQELPQATAEVSLEPACPPPDPSETFTPAQLRRALDEAELPLWEAGDVGVTEELADGRIVWLYADTVRPDGYPTRLIGNSMLISSGDCISQVLPADGEAIVPDAAFADEADARPEAPNPFNDVVQWPMSLVRIPTPAGYPDDVTDVLVGVFNRVQRGIGAWDFLVRGSSLVTFTVAGDGIPRVEQILELTPDDLDLHHVNWGAAAEADEDWLYIYGTRTTGQLYVYGRELYVSRRPVDDPTDADRWEFWNGSTWQADRTRAAPIMNALEGDSESGVSQTLTVARVDGRWMAVSKRGGDVYDEIWQWWSDSPVGPWEGRPVLDVRSGLGSESLTYLPLAHPDIPLSSGGLLVTISTNVSDFERLLREPQLGRPLYFEIPRV
jgi:hypothetical protein